MVACAQWSMLQSVAVTGSRIATHAWQVVTMQKLNTRDHVVHQSPARCSVRMVGPRAKMVVQFANAKRRRSLMHVHVLSSTCQCVVQMARHTAMSAWQDVKKWTLSQAHARMSGPKRSA